MAKNHPELSQTKKANRLINESSTYLLQHAYNPVNWFAWSKEALELAKTSGKPIMLSIGYSACHWCHVMEEESFQDEETAKLINEYFIPIKVDREERPDIDDIYMTAVQLITGHGGWPLTVFLTPQQKPFYGGTYFPKDDRYHGQHVVPGFKTILNAVNQAWQTQRHQAEASANRMTEAIVSIAQQFTKQSNIAAQKHNPSQDLLIESASKLLPSFDPKWGGFAGAPKFPQTLALQLCLQAAFKLQQQNENKKAEPFLEAVSLSLDGMANGGIYDHLGGGFARYSTDEKWLIPHFEKMLYDNALLVKVFLDAYTVIGQANWLHVATETLDFISRELTSEEGGFFSALDADSEGMEGKFYVWQKKEIEKVLGADSQIFCEYFGVTEKGNFEHNNNVLFLKHNAEKTPPKINELKTKLLNYRSKRIRPVRDDKILTNWNGLTISAFVYGYRLSGDKKYLFEAQKAAHFILTNLLKNNRLKHSYAQGKATIDGYLDDYAFFVQGLLDLASIDANPIWSEKAILLNNSMLALFFDTEKSDFFYTANDHEKLIIRPKNFYDGPLPSATSIAITNLLKIEILTNNSSYKNTALSVISQHQPLFNNHPNQYASMISAWDLATNPPLFVVFVISTQIENNNLMLSAIFGSYSSNKIVILKDSNLDSSYDKQLISLVQKNLINRQPTVYICQGQTCQDPINDIDKAKTLLNNS